MTAEAQINDIISSGLEVKGLELLESRSAVRFLSGNEFSTEEMYRFLLNSRNIAKSPITGCEEFSGEFLQLRSENIRLDEFVYELLIEYYKDTYINSIFRKPFTDDLPDSIIVINKVNQYGRCQIGAEIFGSAASPRHIKSSFILAKFINRDGSVDTYSGQVQHFFEHTINQNSTHKLAYVRWYKFVNLTKVRYHFSIDDDAETCNVELWENTFCPNSRDNIIPIHNILG